MRSLDYSGAELRQGIAFDWIPDKTQIKKVNIITGRGIADVKLSEMVDKEDVKNNEPIYSDDMYHMIFEILGETDLEKLVFIQRYIIRLIVDILEERRCDWNTPENRPALWVKGDDILSDAGKLSVSIATVSASSGLIHIGLNANAKKFPDLVKATTLYELWLHDAQNRSSEIFDELLGSFDRYLKYYIKTEFQDILVATSKVTSR